MLANKTINEGTYAEYSATLQDETGIPISWTELDALTLTYYNQADGAIINGRDEQDILNANDVTVDAEGVLLWALQSADTIIVDTNVTSRQLERHVALIEWTWDTTKVGRYEVLLDIRQIDTSPVALGITLDSTWGGPSANSYISLGDAEPFVRWNVIDATAWTTATTDRKIAALAEATRDIDSRQYGGGPLDPEQALEFPRSIGGTAEQTRMLSDVHAACCLQAVHLLTRNTMTGHTDMGAAGVMSYEKRLGPVTEKFRYRQGKGGGAHKQPGGRYQRLCQDAADALSDWTVSRRTIRG